LLPGSSPAKEIIIVRGNNVILLGRADMYIPWLNNRRIRIIGSAFLAAVILLLTILVLPTLGGGGLAAAVSSGTTGVGGGFSIHPLGVYQ
jgi:hypothetical protein